MNKNKYFLKSLNFFISQSYSKKSITFCKNVRDKKMGIFNLWKSIRIVMFFIVALGLIYICYEFGPKAYFALIIYIIAIVFYIMIKRIIFGKYESKEEDSSNYKVSVTMIIEGEDSESFINSIKGLLNQSYPLKEILIININSKNLNIYNTAKRIRKQVELFEESGIKGEIDLGDVKTCPDIIIKRLVGSEGRKSAESWGVTRSTGDLILSCDSNSVLDNSTIEELINHFKDSSISAIIGNMKICEKYSYKLLKIFFKFKNETSYLSAKLKYKICNIIFGDISLSCYRKKTLLNNIKD